MKVLGIDPGTNVTGYGVVLLNGTEMQALDYGCVRPPRQSSSSGKRKIIFESVNHLLDEFAPDALAVESPFVRDNVHTALALGMVHGIAILAASLRDIAVFAYPPSRAKQAVTGRGGASKQQVQGMVKRLLNLSEIPEPHDASDALALAICHIQSATSNRVLGKRV